MESLHYLKLKQMIVYSIIDSEKNWIHIVLLTFIQISNSSILVEVVLFHLHQLCEQVFVVSQELLVLSCHQHFKLVVIIDVTCQVDCIGIFFVESFLLAWEEHEV